MKLSERIAEGRQFAGLVRQRAAAVDCLNGIDANECLVVGGAYNGDPDIHLEKDDPAFSTVRGVIVGLIASANERLRAAGIEVDLADDETGLPSAEDDDGLDGEPEDDEENEINE